MKTILLPSDFSETAQNAMRYALQLFSHTECQFILFNAFSVPQSVGVLISITEILAEDANKGLEKEMRNMLEQLNYPQIQFEVLAMPGSFHELLGHVVKAKKIDLVVMGTQGATKMGERLMGSNTARVLKEVPCPVLAVPHTSYYQKLGTVVSASDGASETGYPGQWETLATMMAGDRPNFITLRIADPDDAEEDAQLFKQMQSKKNAPTVVNDTSEVTAYHANVVEGIRKYVIEHNADMLVLTSHRQNWIGRLFHHSVTQDMVMQNVLPIMVMQELEK